MTRDEIEQKVREVIVDALAVDEDEVSPESTLFGDLGAESIDVLDITFKLEQAFGFKISEGELVPQGAIDDPELVQEGRLTPKGLERLKEQMPHVDFSSLSDEPSIEEIAHAFRVETIINFVERKLAGTNA